MQFWLASVLNSSNSCTTNNITTAWIGLCHVSAMLTYEPANQRIGSLHPGNVLSGANIFNDSTVYSILAAILYFKLQFINPCLEQIVDMSAMHSTVISCRVFAYSLTQKWRE